MNYPQYISFFDAIVNGIIFLISSSKCSLLRNTIFSYILTFQFTVLLNSFVSSMTLFCRFLRIFFFTRACYLQLEIGVNVFCFQCRCLHFFSFHNICLIGTSSMRLNGSGESGRFCLLPDLRGKTPSLPSVKCDVNCGFFLDMPYLVEEVPFYS